MTELGPVLAFSRQSRFHGEPFDLIEPSRSPQLVKGVLPSAGVGFVVGQSKAGKSFFTLDLGLRVAAGAKVLGSRTKQGGCAYIAAEDPNGCRARAMAWRKAHPRGSATPFELIPGPLNLLALDDMEDLKGELAAAASRFEEAGSRLALVVIDTLSRSLPGADENNSVAMSDAFAALEELSRETGALVLVVAHFGKGGGEKGIRGWSGLDAASDATIAIERDETDPDLRLVTLSKVKNGVDGARFAFRLEEVDLGLVDDDGDAITSCVPVFEKVPDGPVKAKKRKALTPPEQIVLQAVRSVTDQGVTHPFPADIEGVKPWQKAVTRNDVRERALVSGLASDEAKGSALRMRFSRAIEGLCAVQKIRAEGELLWLT